ncbi:NAD(P)-binding protein [Ensifer sp. T173]|jgi:2-polyprenyl-6-methoxyphenol hydroxylase-like FAD-dependent oxidoreductase|uniref:NAD(P)-binding protein n=1 Tax=Ensifer canadensis TaxID=555315 RepID=A0AAW4FMB6_9HYPH|nr:MULTISPECIES: NAD(P)/FAD-dependent oxidoreductase [Ensifer]MDP9632311.1 2-polyprenyl-6-methoxyphenol hydroxylase-like FAD-dependent oxidoreductase [Ensifer adhaerens]KQY78439.1 hypothetical protein ASD52_00790 [Ensifer sp. Root142]MBD9488406.1 FAD-dependent monooxygenase [Ensifer sp. ENS11]MBM3092394.1 NAD(P)-binding protein [Ensifer canadensis]NOV16294.1 FAD-dependent monooxygenase [Ensifer canadensis]
MPKQNSIAITGAGIAGLSLAIRLRQTGHSVQIFEARPREASGEGAFLTLAPNGINALRALGLAERVSSLGIPTTGIEILNAAGRRLALLDEREAQRQAGAASITLRRADLLEALRQTASAQGVDIRYDHALIDIERKADGVTLRFGNGESAHAHWLAGCDGVWSRTRRLALPASPEPLYTGLTGTGGFLDCPHVPSSGGVLRLMFGESAFFGYIKAQEGPVFWFDSFTLDEETAIGRPDPAALAARTRAQHAGDAAPVRDIAAAVTSVPRAYPVFDMGHLPRWFDDRVVLLGDAAHAVSPHAGQGASMAIEDAVVLAACLTAYGAPSRAFRAYETLRRDRVEHIVRISRRRGAKKQAKGPVALFLRDLLLPLLLPFDAKTTQAVQRYRADLDPLVLPAA